MISMKKADIQVQALVFYYFNVQSIILRRYFMNQFIID